MTASLETATLIIGGGPAGLASLLAASRSALLGELLDHGLVIAERGDTIGQGSIGQYVINSDSSAATFLTSTQSRYPKLSAVAHHKTAHALAAYGTRSVPLHLAGTLLAQTGRAMRDEITTHANGRVLTRHEALWTRRLPDGGWVTRLRRHDGRDPGLRHVDIRSRSVVLATGGSQPRARLQRERVADIPLLPQFEDKLIQSEEALTAAGIRDIGARLAGLASPRIVIVGGSTSAVSVAHTLLRRLDHPRLGTSAITLMHRQELRLFYPSREAALADGYDEFGPDDICPVSGFVYRFQGMRFDNHGLVRRLRGFGGRPAETRVRLHPLDRTPQEQTRACLEAADLIIACLGYRPNALPVRDVSGAELALLAHEDDRAPLVGAHCGVLDTEGHEIPGLLGIGLACGFRPGGALGGEPSFRGQANGLWLWQNDIGLMIAQQALERARPTASAATETKSAVPIPVLCRSVA